MTKDFPESETGTAVAAIDRKLRGICRPELAQEIASWMANLSPTGQPSGYFMQRTIFPMLLLPGWMASSCGAWDQQFQSDVVYSTINGYYFIRLLDNVMDQHFTVERELLPMSAFFHSEFQSIYHRYFEVGHPFWRWFDSLWIGSAEAVVREKALSGMDFDSFVDVAVSKLDAAKIPLVAVHYHYGQRSSLAPWLQLSYKLAQWWQFLDDLMDWHKDLLRGASTYFLCKAQRCKRSDESIHRWVAREGFQWGVDTLTGWMAEAQTMSSHLDCPEAGHLLQDRMAMLNAIAAELTPGLQALERLALAMETSEVTA